MEDLLKFISGMLGTTAVAIGLVLGAASTLQAWHTVGQPAPPSMAIEHQTVAGAAASSYWSGRL